jgi:beta-lactamase regulating signal transducer with metallopeptidase domain
VTGAAAFGAWLLRTSLEASVLILLILALRFALRRRLSPRWQYALWLLVVARLALPVLPPSPTSVFNLGPVSPVPPSLVRVSVAAPDTPAAAVAVRAAAPTVRDWPLLLVAVWGAVALLLLARIVVRSYQLTARVCRQRPVTRPDVVDLLEDCKQELGVHIPINVVQSAGVATPALLGFLRPRLLLPERLLDTFDGEALRLLFLHELAHVRRRDILVNWFATVLHIVHWFNPLVAFAMARMRADRELATDSLVLSQRGETQNRTYGDTLIRLVEFAAAPSLLPGTVGVLEDKVELKRRVAMIATHKADGYQRSLLAAGLLLALAGTTLTGAVHATSGGRATSASCAGQADVVAALRASRADLAPQLDALTGALPEAVCLSSVDPTARVLEAQFFAVKGTAKTLDVIQSFLEKLRGPEFSDPELRGTQESGGTITFEVWAKYSPAPSAAAEATAAAQQALSSWLALIDAGQYGESWEQASSDFRKREPRATWEKKLEKQRAPLGSVVSRTLRTAEHKTAVPGAPDGEYVVIENTTSFEKGATIERLTAKKGEGDEWRAVGYFILPDTSAAEKALGDWLALVDAQKYGASWDAASSYFRANVSRAEWGQSVQQYRAPLGAVISRKTQSAQATDELPGAPAGHYVVVQTETKFAKKAAAVETCALQQTADGWRVAGYHIR